jgi:peptidoglycan/xylan/chitin deacetylase (PgdA/CDA1 family)
LDITLSFDNGPTQAVTPQVLDILAERGLKATFFLVGHRLAEEDNRRLATQARDQGHWIGNHGWSHSVPLGASPDPDAADNEISRTQTELGALAHPDKLFRPFGGGGRIGPHLLSAGAARVLTEGAYTCVLWNSVPRDWLDADGWLETAKTQVRSQPWSAIVLHDHLANGAMRHLSAFLDWAADAGAVFRQDFPPSVMPILRGRIMTDLSPYVTPA